MFHFIKRLIQNMFWFIVIAVIVYAFLSLCNWSYNIGNWNGFSRFLFAIIELIMLLASWESMSNVIKNLKAK